MKSLINILSETVVTSSVNNLKKQSLDEDWKYYPHWHGDGRKTDIERLADNFDFSWEGVNNIDDWWTGKDYIDVGDYMEEIVDDASDALSDFVDDSTAVAEEFADYLVDTYETVADWTAELVQDVADMGSSVINWIKKQADSVIWYWTKGPGGRFLRGCGQLFSELAQFVVRPTTGWKNLKLKINVALATGDTDYLESLSDAIICGAGILLTALTALSVGLLGGVATATLYAIALFGFFKYFATNATKVRIGFPSHGWEYVVQKAAQTLGVFSGVFTNLSENKEWWDAYPTSAKVDTLFIGSHGKARNILTLTQESGGTQENEEGEFDNTIELFDPRFLSPIKSHVDANTKVFFTACYGANSLVALKKASEYLGCECYGCEGVGWAGFGCEEAAWACDTKPPLKDVHKERLPFDFMESLLDSGRITDGCSIEKPDNIGEIQKFLVDRGVDMGKSGYYKNGIDFKKGNSTAIGIGKYLGYPNIEGERDLLYYLKDELGFENIISGGWGKNTNNLISMLIGLKCSQADKTVKSGEEGIMSNLSQYIELAKAEVTTLSGPTDREIVKSGGCHVVTNDDWFMDYLA